MRLSVGAVPLIAALLIPTSAFAAQQDSASAGAPIANAKAKAQQAVKAGAAMPSLATGAASAATAPACTNPSTKAIDRKKCQSAYKPTKIVYLTFDDGPGGIYTQDILHDLKAAGAHATFFETGDVTTLGALAGENTTASGTAQCNATLGDTCSYPTTGMATGLDLYGQTGELSDPINQSLPLTILAGGNQLGLHSWDHPHFDGPVISTSPAITDEEISDVRNEQMSLTVSKAYPNGYDSGIFRYPYNTNSPLGDAYLASQGMQSTVAVDQSFEIDPNDWDKGVTDAQIVAAVMTGAEDETNQADAVCTYAAYGTCKGVVNGSVIDLHDGTDAVGRTGVASEWNSAVGPTYLPLLLNALKAAGYSFGVMPSSQDPNHNWSTPTPADGIR